MELYKVSWFEGEKNYKETFNTTPETAAESVKNVLKYADNVTVKKFNVK